MNTARVFLGALMIRPEFAPESLSALNIDDFPADLQSVFAALSGFLRIKGHIGHGASLCKVSASERHRSGVRV